ncbi:unnamed protein product [Schistosoma mattheei]|uniref:Uncharacterized protein n=1 Tax=Schistosoma mattheei TaxID=31246 RepID=A0A3P8KQB0_9TREM|nr:unnamed protein product [Schistosoma mattheei]
MFGYTIAYGPDSNTVNVGHDLNAGVDSHSSGESVSKSLESTP